MRRTAVLSAIAASMFLIASFAAFANCSENGTVTAENETILGSGGTGIPDTTWYNVTATSFSINNADQLAGLARIVNGLEAPGILKDSFVGKTVTLADNIDLSSYGGSFNGGKGWSHIGASYGDAFKGTFDGNGKKVTNLYANATDMADGYYVGLFGALLEGTIKNLAVVGADVTGREYVGCIVGYISNGGSVTNCYSSGTVAGRNYIGGIAGGNGINSTLTNCYSACDVDGYYAVGGITGKDSDTGRTSNCYSTGSVSGDDSVGGIAGIVTGGYVTECAALNPVVKGTNNVGRVSGMVNGNGISTNNIAFVGMSKTPAKSGGDNGIDATPSWILHDGTLGGRFTDAHGWITHHGTLPRLFGGTEEVPEFILTWVPAQLNLLFVIMLLAVCAVLAVGSAAFWLTRKK